MSDTANKEAFLAHCEQRERAFIRAFIHDHPLIQRFVGPHPEMAEELWVRRKREIASKMYDTTNRFHQGHGL